MNSKESRDIVSMSDIIVSIVTLPIDPKILKIQKARRTRYRNNFRVFKLMKILGLIEVKKST